MERLADARELLDGPLADREVLEGNLRDLRRVNRWLGGSALSVRALRRLQLPVGRPVRLLDVGTGAADIPRAFLADAARRGQPMVVLATDARPEVLAAALAVDPSLRSTPGLELAVADAAALPYPDASFDVGHCSLVVHHLDRQAAVTALAELRRVSRYGVLVNDLARGRPFWLGARLLARLTGNAYTRHDGPLSVRRAWTEPEARDLCRDAGLMPIASEAGLFGHRWAIAAVPNMRSPGGAARDGR